MMPRHHRRLAAEDGFSLIELLVAMTVSVIILLATLGALDAFNNGVASTNRLTDATDAARSQVATMVSVLRDAGAPTPVTGVQPTTVVQAGVNDIVFLSTSWPGESGVGVGAGTNHIERYCLDTATSTVWFNGLKAGTAGSVTPGAACPSTASGWTSSLVASNVLNTVADPLFVYGSMTPVRAVSVNLRLQGGTALKSRTVELRSGGTLRGALPPAISASDIVVGACQGGRALLTLSLADAGATANGAVMTAPNSVPVGVGQILVPATGTPAGVVLTITNLLGLQTLLTKTVSC
jgi:prepilin-type N-terminal cleavage/methylation domain-containing protein